MGVAARQTYVLKSLDGDYFDEGCAPYFRLGANVTPNTIMRERSP